MFVLGGGGLGDRGRGEDAGRGEQAGYADVPVMLAVEVAVKGSLGDDVRMDVGRGGSAAAAGVAGVGVGLSRAENLNVTCWPDLVILSSASATKGV